MLLERLLSGYWQVIGGVIGSIADNWQSNGRYWQVYVQPTGKSLAGYVQAITRSQGGFRSLPKACVGEDKL